MIRSWICWVPSKMSRIFASRAHFSSSSSSPRPVDAAERDAAQRDVDAGPAGLRLRVGGVQGVRLAVVGHPCGLHRQQAGGLEVGLHREQLGGGGALPARPGGPGSTSTPASASSSVVRSRQARVEADGHRGDERARVVERPHRAGEALLRVDLGAAEEVLLRDPAVVEDEGGGVGGADAELVLEPIELQARVRALDDERLDRRAALLGVEARPDDDEVGPLAGGDVDLLAVEDVVVAVERRRSSGSRPSRTRPRAR